MTCGWVQPRSGLAVLAAVWLLALTGCGSGASNPSSSSGVFGGGTGVSLQVKPSTTESGKTVRVLVKNSTDGRLFVGSDTRLDVESGSETWSPVYELSSGLGGGAPTAMPYNNGHFSSVGVGVAEGTWETLKLPAGLPAGTYRLVKTVVLGVVSGSPRHNVTVGAPLEVRASKG